MNELGQPRKYCPAPDIPRKGACGSNGQNDCVLKVLGAYPASKMPSKIHCVDVGKYNSKCISQIVCDNWINSELLLDIYTYIIMIITTS